MNRIALLLAAGLLAPAPAALAASSAPGASGDAWFDAFTQVCGDTHADYAAVVAAAQAGGWTAAEVSSAPMDKVTVAETLSRATKVDGVALTLSAWHGATKSGVTVTGCTVRVSKADVAGAGTAAQAWLGFAPQVADAHKTAFHFTEADGARKAVDASQNEAAAGGAGLQMLTISGDAKGTVLDLLKIKK